MRLMTVLNNRLVGIGMLAATLGMSGSLHAADYAIDGTDAGMHAAVNFHANHMGISQLWGRFNDISGSFNYDAGNVAASSISVTIDPASIDTNHEERDIHLRSSDYLNVDKFPEAGFESTAIEDLGNDRIQVTGDFTLHGVSKEISFEAVRTGEGETPFGDYRVGFAAETTLNVADFGINLGADSTLTLLLAIEGIRR